MATRTQKIRAEKRMRDVLAESGLPQPDHVEYGFTCLVMASKMAVVVDIDEPAGARPGSHGLTLTA